jgi:cation-transporting ATPase E
MSDTVTGDGKGIDQDSGRASNANMPIGRTTAIKEPPIGNHYRSHTLLQGLTEEEVRLRRTRGQGNNIKLQTSRTYLQILRENILTPIHLILFALSGVLILLGRPLDAIITLGVICFNLVVGIVQEVRAKRSLDHISLLTRPAATVIRAGNEFAVDPSDVVLGDVLVVRPGDQIVVDGCLVGNGWIDVDESLLTGESDLIRKRPGDRVTSGSFCVNGSALYEAVQVGAQSTAYRLTAGARTFRRVLTPLQRQATTVIRILLFLACYLGLSLLMITTIRQTPLLQMVQMAVVIAGLVPNGLLLAIAVAYGLAAMRLANTGVLIQQANAVESLSNVTVLCCDKTGTLTANGLYVHAVKPFGISEEELGSLLGVYASSVSTSNTTSAAIAAAYPAQAQTTSAEVPFSSASKWSALTLAETQQVYVLGAPEMLEPFLQPESRLGDQVAAWTDQGLRVLLFARYDEPMGLYDADGQPRLLPGLLPLGLVSMGDILRPQARETMEVFIQAGVQLKIISGDHPHTVAALARQAGLAADLTSVSGMDLSQMEPAQFAQVVRDTTVFGRITPQQKERIVKELRAQGAYVAMVGDGLNDVLSLKGANLGIAIQSGSQMARSAADLVLLGDSFAALPRAVQEGQRVVNGMRDILTLFLTRVASFTLLILLIPGFPFSPRQASLVTLMTVGIPTIALAAWAQPGPARGNKPLLGHVHFVLPAILTGSLATLFVFLLAVALAVSRGLPEAVVMVTARSTITVFAAVSGVFLLVFVAPPTRFLAGGNAVRGDWRPAVLAAVLIGGLTLLLSIPPGRAVFEIGSLPLFDVVAVVGVALLWMLLLLFIWRFRLLERVLAIESQEEPSSMRSNGG